LTSLRYSVIEHLGNEDSTNEARAPVAYFYCTRNPAEQQRTDPDEIMRSILKQLSCSDSFLPIREPVAKIYKERKKEANMDGSELEKLTITGCRDVILSLLESNPATIIIDAFDECNPARRDELRSALHEIIQGSAYVVKVFVSSRDDNDIVNWLEKSPNVFIRASDNGEDIERFVNSEVNHAIKRGKLLSGSVSEDLKSKITTTLIEGAQGMYVLHENCLIFNPANNFQVSMG
jgi:hypothetical protein